jgi:predicted dienelactone hydrolase
MKNLSIKQLLLLTGFVLFNLANPHISVAQVADMQFINGDPLPDAPELAQRGKYKIGVRTMEIIHMDQLDILNSKEGNEVRYDRRLKLEIWYPAIIPQGQNDLITYAENRGVQGDPKKPFIQYSFSGRALRDAAPVTGDEPFPLIIVSHGYVGSRLLMSYLTENLASKGYVVVSIDHLESTYNDAGGFQSTLLNRSNDILFVLGQVAEMSKPGSSNFLSGIVDATNTGLIGYSMGGYGVLNAAGAGYSAQIIKMFGALAGGSKAIEVLTAGNPEYIKRHDDRIKAVVAFAPWGMERGAWDSESLKGLSVPVFFVAGSQDDVSGYEKGTKAIFTGAVNSDRYLLTYVNARHNVAPNPPPAESLKPGLPFDFYYHYAEPSWDQRRINNINQHFVTAFLGIQLKKMEYGKYLEVGEISNLKTWTGFKPRTSVGLELVHTLPVQ